MAARRPGRPGWQRQYQLLLFALDALVLLATVLITVALHGPTGSKELQGLPALVVALTIGLLWWAALALTRTYEARFLGEGPEEVRRVVQASVRLATTVGVFCYLGHLPVSRGMLAIQLALGTVLLLGGRLLGRTLLNRQRRQARWGHRVVVVGTAGRVVELAGQLSRKAGSGYQVVGVCVPAGHPGLGVPTGALTDILALVAQTGADSVAVTAGPALTPAELRRLGYDLEVVGVDLLVAPALLDVAGSRVRVHHVADLPLLYLDEPQLAGGARLFKDVLDRLSAAAALIALSPLLLVGGLLMRCSGDGSVLISRPRVGRDGQMFDQLQFRYPRLADLPSLLNVLLGQMSFVGPRPLSPILAEGPPADQRRLLVKPGLTGLTQVHGRAGITLAEATRSDQRYVDNWTLGLDAVLLARTATRLVGSKRRG